MVASDSNVLGVDIGTTSTKAISFRPDGSIAAEAIEKYPLHTPDAIRAEQDPDRILFAVRTCLRKIEDAQREVSAIAFSSFMHSLIAVDAAGEALTPCFTWADRRARPQADALGRAGRAAGLHARTGTPVQAMSPLTKLIWLRENDPGTHAKAARFVGIKEYVCHHLYGEGPVDHSVASSTGLFDLQALDWDEEALRLAGIDASRLSRPVPTTHVLEGHGIPVVVGATDGVLANLGAGATTPGILAVSLGTSGAARAVVTRITPDPQCRLFCYALDGDRWVVGGAISNAGLALRWLRDELARGHISFEELLCMAAEVPPGANGLLCLPFLTGERFARYSLEVGGVFAGLSLRHGLAQMTRALLEGIVLCLDSVIAALEELTTPATEIRIGGALGRSPLLQQMLADVRGCPVGMVSTEQISALGAARLGLRALGREDLPTPEILRRHEPDRSAHARYQDLAARHDELYASCAPVLARGREQGPGKTP